MVTFMKHLKLKIVNKLNILLFIIILLSVHILFDFLCKVLFNIPN